MSAMKELLIRSLTYFNCHKIVNRTKLPRPASLFLLLGFFRRSSSCCSLLFLFLVATKESRDLAHNIGVIVNVPLICVGQSQIEPSSVVELNSKNEYTKYDGQRRK